MKEPIHIISLGAGVQSSTMALMAAAGEITPMPVAAIFADTQAEPQSVYKWLDWLEKQLPFPVYRVTKGNLTDYLLLIRERRDRSGLWSKGMLPAFIKNPDGTKGIMRRQCTQDFKVDIIKKHVRKLAGIKRGQSTVGVVQWIGISQDEIYRMKPSMEKWCHHRWPLIELSITRRSCLAWMEKRNYPKPPRSACIYCPYHSDLEWRRLRDEEPDEWRRVIEFEQAFQSVKSKTDRMKGVPFLHASLKPLSEVDFSTEEERGQLSMFNNECEGMCGV